MKKVLLSAICVFMIFISARATDKTDRQEYIGYYVFSVENLVETLEITLQEDSTLMAFSSLGEVTLTPVEKDRFVFPQYGGIIVFERNEKQEITACKISVAAIDMEEIKALKQ
ncbi:MAG: hypothetical protein LBP83_02145 [Dysgonamonadaceae bacterium]|jgi:hypothetical protein|nr:hypothetical protein [Dysgonamonadaceae bacterium]